MRACMHADAKRLRLDKQEGSHCEKFIKTPCIYVNIRVCICVYICVCVCMNIYRKSYTHIYACMHACRRQASQAGQTRRQPL